MTSPRPGYSSHFGINNIPFGIASSQINPLPTCVSRYEDKVIFLNRLNQLFADIPGFDTAVFAGPTLNTFAALSKSIHEAVRKRLQTAIRTNKSLDEPNQISFAFPDNAIEHISIVTMYLPVQVGDFTDFSCSLNHVQNASEAMTGSRSIPPAFFNMPIGYAGRCSSLSVSGVPVERPLGQFREGNDGEQRVVFGPSAKMDYELELGCIVGKPLAQGERVMSSDADEHIFGYVLVNDWSARDIQALEMIPLGPLNGKNAGTTVSPWIITSEALAAFRTSPPQRAQEPARYLYDSANHALDIKFEIRVNTPSENSSKLRILCRSKAASMYWTLGQCLAHQAIGGCGLRTGDLLASGTVSGTSSEERGCLLEHMRQGAKHPRGYLQDGETVTLTGFCGDGVGFGECEATLMPARDLE